MPYGFGYVPIFSDKLIYRSIFRYWKKVRISLREPLAGHPVWGKAAKPGFSVQTLSRNVDEIGFYPYLLQNKIDEPNGRLIVSVLSSSNYTISPSQGSSTIILVNDDVPSVSFTTYNQKITEGASVTMNIQASIAPWRNIEIDVGSEDRGTSSLSSAPSKATILAGETTTSITIQSDLMMTVLMRLVGLLF